MNKTAIIALGGNALSQKKEAGTMSEQFNNTRHSFAQIMEFIRRGYNVCLTHGNGPQVGDELLRMDLTRDVVPPIPLGICVAGTQGTMGYMIQQTFQNALREEKIDKEEDETDKDLRYGLIVIGNDTEGIFVQCGNLILIEDVPKLLGRPLTMPFDLFGLTFLSIVLLIVPFQQLLLLSMYHHLN